MEDVYAAWREMIASAISMESAVSSARNPSILDLMASLSLRK